MGGLKEAVPLPIFRRMPFAKKGFCNRKDTKPVRLSHGGLSSLIARVYRKGCCVGIKIIQEGVLLTEAEKIQERGCLRYHCKFLYGFFYAGLRRFFFCLAKGETPLLRRVERVVRCYKRDNLQDHHVE